MSDCSQLGEHVLHYDPVPSESPPCQVLDSAKTGAQFSQIIASSAELRVFLRQLSTFFDASDGDRDHFNSYFKAIQGPNLNDVLRPART